MIIIDPDCEAGKHRNCDGAGWDDAADQLAPCPCTCHEMRVLTVRQPWGWAIVHGGKDVENRVRNVAGSYRGPVAIHAGLAAYEQSNMASTAHKLAHGSEADTAMVFGGIIGVVDLAEVHMQQDCLHNVGLDNDDPDNEMCSEWAQWSHDVDLFHLVLANPRALRQTIPFTGALGLRRLDPTTIRKIQEQL